MNKIVLIGRITKDLDLRKTTNGTSVLKFTLAVNRRFNNDTQEADFISCIAWEKRAEVMYQYLKKGSRIGIVGRLQTGSYEGQDGRRVYTTDVVVDEIDFLEQKQQRDTESATHTPKQDNYYSEEALYIENDDLPF